MECSIEGSNLRHIGENRTDGLDTEYVRVVVQRGKLAAVFYLGKHILIYDSTAGEEIRTLDDTVSDSLNILECLEHAGAGGDQILENIFHTDRVIGNGDLADNLVPSCRRIADYTLGEAYFLYLSLGEEIEDVVALHVEQLILYGRTATVDD